MSARKGLHTPIFGGLRNPFPEKSPTKNLLSFKDVSGMTFPQNALDVFVCDAENYMETDLGIILLENLIAVTCKSVFRINFASISGSTALIKGYGLSGSQRAQRFRTCEKVC